MFATAIHPGARAGLSPPVPSPAAPLFQQLADCCGIDGFEQVAVEPRLQHPADELAANGDLSS
jgi:hypothetical protein